MTEPDHLVIGCDALDGAAAWARERLGAEPLPGGAHPGLGTHNLLLGLGPGFYLELIARDPAQDEPAAPRMFGLDDPAVRARLRRGPALLSFVARTDDLDALLGRLPGHPAARDMARGALRWRLAAAPVAPFGALLPALIAWPANRSAAAGLADSGLRLRALRAEHPDGEGLRDALTARGLDGSVSSGAGPAPRLLATLRHPDGAEVTLDSRDGD